MKLLKQLSRYGLELFLAASGIWAIAQKFEGLTKAWGLAMFLGGIVFAVYKVRSSLEQLTTDTATTTKALQQLVVEVDVLQGDSHLRQLAEARRLIDERQAPHLYAGHGATQRVYDHGAALIHGLRQLQRNESDQFRVEEKHIINDLLGMLATALPAPSVWLGVTHLTAGWQNQEADPGFVDFRETMQRRSRAGELYVLRLYCVGDAIPEGLREHLRDEIDSGVHVGIITGDDAPPDLSLIYTLTDRNVTFDPDVGRGSLLRDGTPICGLEFRTRSRRSIDSVYFYTPGSDNFRYLANQFDQAWRRREQLAR